MSTTLCGSVANTVDQIQDCDNLPVKGMESYAMIMDYNDYLNAKITKADDIVSNIVLPSGKEAIEAQVPANYTKERFAGEKGDSGNTYYTHEIDLLIPNTAVGKKFVKNMGNGKFVVIAEKKAKGADKQDAFDILGVDTGLEGTPTFDSDANDGYILATLASPEARESKPPLTFFDADYLTGKAKIDALKNPGGTTTLAATTTPA